MSALEDRKNAAMPRILALEEEQFNIGLDIVFPEFKNKDVKVMLKGYWSMVISCGEPFSGADGFQSYKWDIEVYSDCIHILYDQNGNEEPKSLDQFIPIIKKLLSFHPKTVMITGASSMPRSFFNKVRDFRDKFIIDQEMECMLNGSDYRPIKGSKPRKSKEEKKEKGGKRASKSALVPTKASLTNRGSSKKKPGKQGKTSKGKSSR